MPLFHFEFFQPMQEMYIFGMLNWIADITFTYMIVLVPVLMVLQATKRT